MSKNLNALLQAQNVQMVDILPHPYGNHESRVTTGIEPLFKHSYTRRHKPTEQEFKADAEHESTIRLLLDLPLNNSSQLIRDEAIASAIRKCLTAGTSDVLSLNEHADLCIFIRSEGWLAVTYRNTLYNLEACYRHHETFGWGDWVTEVYAVNHYEIADIEPDTGDDTTPT